MRSLAPWPHHVIACSRPLWRPRPPKIRQLQPEHGPGGRAPSDGPAAGRFRNDVAGTVQSVALARPDYSQSVRVRGGHQRLNPKIYDSSVHDGSVSVDGTILIMIQVVPSVARLGNGRPETTALLGALRASGGPAGGPPLRWHGVSRATGPT